MPLPALLPIALGIGKFVASTAASTAVGKTVNDALSKPDQKNAKDGFERGSSGQTKASGPSQGQPAPRASIKV